jgi:hypothetical protein
VEKLKIGAIWVVVMYFWINAMADNPKEIEYVRQQMNAVVEEGHKMIRKAVR